jgi:hypothetical protein
MQYVVKSERGQHHKRSALIVVVETRVPMMAACEVNNVKHSIDRLDHDVPDMAWARKAEVLREAFHVVSKDSLGARTVSRDAAAVPIRDFETPR